MLPACNSFLHGPFHEIKKESKVLHETIEVNIDKSANLFYGEVKDIETNEQLPFTNIELSNPNKLVKISADSHGSFEVRNVLPGYYSIRFLFIGYLSLAIDSLLIENGKNFKMCIGLRSNHVILD